MKRPSPGFPSRLIFDGGIPIDLHIIGIRAKAIPTLSVRDASGILLAGIAGALDPSLEVGDVVVDAPGVPVPADLPWHLARIHTSENIVSTPAQKAKLHRETGAMAVDMESSAVRDAAEAWSVPFISVRAISDTADEAIDPAVLSCIDEYGRLRPLALAKGLIRRPGLMPALRRLGANSAHAASAVAEAVRLLIEADCFGLKPSKE